MNGIGNIFYRSCKAVEQTSGKASLLSRPTGVMILIKIRIPVSITAFSTRTASLVLHFSLLNSALVDILLLLI